MMPRSSLVLLTIATTLLASTSHAVPQQTGSSGGARTTVRTRCATCGVRDSTLRTQLEQMFFRIDSLNWQYENTRLSNAERERVTAELQRSVEALQSLIDQEIRAEAAYGQRLASTARRAPLAVATPGVAIAMATKACQPSGWLGATFDGLHQKDCINNELIVRFYRYPIITMVEPSSPADRAGIVQGDTVLAFDGTDVTQSGISFTKLLVPDARLTVRVRREGDTKDLRVTVAEAPHYYVMRSAPLPTRGPAQATPVAPPVPVRVRTAMPPAGQFPARGMVWVSGEGLAGAHVQTISEGLGRTVGVKEGVLVLSVRPGTPAFRSGLRDGDVIRRASGRSVSNVVALQRIVSEGEENGYVILRIRRDKKDRDVTLRWKELEP
jgi:C-terminal processing protease CtpA/Prc